MGAQEIELILGPVLTLFIAWSLLKAMKMPTPMPGRWAESVAKGVRQTATSATSAAAHRAKEAGAAAVGGTKRLGAAGAASARTALRGSHGAVAPRSQHFVARPSTSTQPSLTAARSQAWASDGGHAFVPGGDLAADWRTEHLRSNFEPQGADEPDPVFAGRVDDELRTLGLYDADPGVRPVYADWQPGAVSDRSGYVPAVGSADYQELVGRTAESVRHRADIDEDTSRSLAAERGEALRDATQRNARLASQDERMAAHVETLRANHEQIVRARQGAGAQDAPVGRFASEAQATRFVADTADLAGMRASDLIGDAELLVEAPPAVGADTLGGEQVGDMSSEQLAERLDNPLLYAPASVRTRMGGEDDAMYARRATAWMDANGFIDPATGRPVRALDALGVDRDATVSALQRSGTTAQLQELQSSAFRDNQETTNLINSAFKWELDSRDSQSGGAAAAAARTARSDADAADDSAAVQSLDDLLVSPTDLSD